jgi:DNA-binding LytR/AlgR family response regulator
MSGIGVGHVARRMRPEIKVILVSGYPNPAAKAGHYSIHDFDFLKKPYRFSDVAKFLEKPN